MLSKSQIVKKNCNNIIKLVKNIAVILCLVMLLLVIIILKGGITSLLYF